MTSVRFSGRARRPRGGGDAVKPVPRRIASVGARNLSDELYEAFLFGQSTAPTVYVRPRVCPGLVI